MNVPPEYIGGLPNICGSEAAVEDVVRESRDKSAFRADSHSDFAGIRSATAIALHMHQPLIPAGGADLQAAAIISNLRQMMGSGSDEQRHNADIFRWCYKRMGEFIPQLVGEGREPRVMLDYSGTLLWDCGKWSLAMCSIVCAR